MAGFHSDAQYGFNNLRPEVGKDAGSERSAAASSFDNARAELSLAAFSPDEQRATSVKLQEKYALTQAEARTMLPEHDKRNNVGELAGRPASSNVGSALELNALVHALSHDPTPEGLGKEGCMASISHYVIEPGLKRSSAALPHFVDSHEFLTYINKHPELAEVRSRSQREIQAADLQPGDIVVGDKSTGNHVMVATRVPEFWGYPPGSIMLCGNTGLAMPDGPPYPHFRAAQEVIGAGTDQYNYHHGQLNSQRATNPYLGGTFRIVRFKDQ